MDDPSVGMSSFLPTIKCSMCAQDIEISMMGEHVCAIASEPTPPPELDRTFGFLKPRMQLARVDTAAANRPFLRHDSAQQPLTPVSASSSYRTLSPYSSIGGTTPFDTQPPRSATAPLPQRSALSPEKYTGILDNRFSPFGATIPEPLNTPRTQNASFLGSERYEEPEQYAPASPSTVTSRGLLQRMNTIAPGPFDINRRRNGSSRTESNGSADEDVNLLKAQPTTTHKSQVSVGSHGVERQLSDGLKIPKVERVGDYGGFGPPPSRNEERIKSSQNRSQMFPSGTVSRLEKDDLRQQPDPSPFRRPSNAESLASSLSEVRRPSAPDLSRPVPPHSASFIGGRDERRLADVPVPGVDLASEFGVGNPYHTPSESQSSTTSGASQESTTSSRSSPPSSSSGAQRQSSDTSNIDLLMTDIESSISNLNSKQLTSNTNPPKPEPQVTEQYVRKIPTNLRSKSRDPAIQGGQFSPVSPGAPSPPLLQRLAPSSTIRRPATAKGNCKGCGLPIKGKSVSSADGHLTGRYHKDCFVCKTCSEPFATASFYVLNDAPYCERHYHKLNNSICHSCDRGIEGQYLETQRSQKYHPNCLTCSDCKRILKRDYFEMDGKVYCERDSFRRAQQRNFLGPGGATSRMERRTTKLMFMG